MSRIGDLGRTLEVGILRLRVLGMRGWRLLLRWVRAGLRLGCGLGLLVLVLPPLQVMLLQWVDPPLTLTMVSRSLDHWEQDGTLTWPERNWVAIEEVPPHVVQALIAAEDAKFFTHAGFDLEAIEHAWSQVQEGGSLRGGSTLSQQLAKNVFLWQQRSWLRKGAEAYYTLWLELIISKRRILEVYLNVAELGPMTFGVEAGARHWFGCATSELSRSQAALLVSLLPAPRTWTPQTTRVQRKAGRLGAAAVELPADW